MLIIAGLFLLGVASVGILYSVTRTDYLPRLAVWLVKQSLPIIMKRKSPEEEAAWRQVIRQGEEWDHLKKRPREKK